MSTTVLSHKEVTARKEYYDGCADHMDWGIYIQSEGKLIVDEKQAKQIGMTDDEIKTLQILRDRNFRILVGEKHFYQSGVYDNEFYTVRMSKGAYEILTKYDLWYED